MKTDALFAALFLCPGILIAQGARPLPKPIDRVPAAARGGAPGSSAADGVVRAHWITSTQSTPVGKGKFRFRSSGADAVLEIDLPGLMNLRCGSVGGQVWIFDPLAGPAVMEDKAAIGWQRVLRLLGGDWSWQGSYEQISQEHDARLGGAAVRAYDLQPSLGNKDTWLVDPDSGELRKAVVHVVNGIGEVEPLELLFSEWGGEGGRRHPRRCRLRLAHMEFALDWTAVAFGQEVDPGELSMGKDELERARRTGVRKMTELGESAIALRTVTEVPVASIRTRVPMADIGKALAILIPEAMAAVTKQGIRPLGAPFTRYHGYDAKEADLEVGIPLARPIEAAGRVRSRVLPAGRVAVAWHVGPYHTLSKTYDRIKKWIADRGLQVAGPSWEMYWTDPGLVRDPNRWRTELFFPIK